MRVSAGRPGSGLPPGARARGPPAAAGGDGVQELPDVLLAPVLHRLLHEPTVDPPAIGQIGELAILTGEPPGGFGVHATGGPAAAVVFLPEGTPGELRQGVGGDSHTGLPLELSRQELQPLPAPALGLDAAEAEDGSLLLEQ